MRVRERRLCGCERKSGEDYRSMYSSRLLRVKLSSTRVLFTQGIIVMLGLTTAGSSVCTAAVCSAETIPLLLDERIG